MRAFFGLLALLSRCAALDCKAEGLSWLDQTFHLSESIDTPPSVTDIKVFVNPCGSIKGDELCAADDQFCVVESVTEGSGRSAKTIVAAVKPFGSKEQGAAESLSKASDKLSVEFNGAKWGSSTLKGTVEVVCFDKEDVVLEIDQPLNYKLLIKSPSMCSKGKQPDEDTGKEPKAPNDAKSGGWGFFTWLFVLLVLAGIGYVALTVYINFAQSRGNLPLAADVGDVLRDLPYLLRDIFRKLNFMGRSSSSGYAAL